jgi:hypothetical protein
MRIEGDFNVRGGIHTRVVTWHGERPVTVPEPPN